MNPLASLTITYLVGVVCSLILYFALNKDADIAREYGKTSLPPFALGLAIVGLEAGYIYAYKAGWQISIAPVVQSAFLAVALMLIGALLFKEALT